MIKATHSPLFVVKDLFEARFKGADVILLGGSVVRGEASSYSDIDLVVIYPRVQNAYRESFYHLGWPVEAWVHDLETLHFALKNSSAMHDRGSLPEMIAEGLEVPNATEASKLAKGAVEKILRVGPAALDESDVNERRYQLSALLDDLREPGSREEMVASASVLYFELADFFLRSKGYWSCRGKSVLKRLRKCDVQMYRKFTESFELLFRHGSPLKVIELGEDILQSSGGLLFENHRQDLPASARLVWPKS